MVYQITLKKYSPEQYALLVESDFENGSGIFCRFDINPQDPRDIVEKLKLAVNTLESAAEKTYGTR